MDLAPYSRKGDYWFKFHWFYQNHLHASLIQNLAYPTVYYYTYKVMQTNPLLELQVSYSMEYTLHNEPSITMLHLW